MTTCRPPHLITRLLPLLLACVAPLLLCHAQHPNGEQTATPSLTKIIIDDHAKQLTDAHLAPLRKRAVNLLRQHQLRFHFVTAFRNPQKTPDDLAQALLAIITRKETAHHGTRDALLLVLLPKPNNADIPPAVAFAAGSHIQTLLPLDAARARIAKNLHDTKDANRTTQLDAFCDLYHQLADALASQPTDTPSPQEKRLLATAVANALPNQQPQTPASDAPQPPTPRRHASIPDPGVPAPYHGDIPPKPAHRRFVLDWGQLLTPADRAFVEQHGRLLEQLTSAELVLVTVPTRGDVPIKDFAFNLASSWGIGKRDKDNGCLLLAIADRLRTQQPGKIRIEVGKGLEGRLNDAKCGRILDEIALPPFAADNTSPADTSAGLAEAYAYLAAQIAAEYNQSLGQDFDQNYAQLPPPPEQTEANNIGEGLSLLLIAGFFIILFILDRFFKLLGSSSSRHTRRGFSPHDDTWSSSSGSNSGGDYGGGSFGGGGADR